MNAMFCGHREISDIASVENWLFDICIHLIHSGTTDFFCGGYGRYDLLSAKVIYQLKKEYPHIRSILVLPYLNHNLSLDYYDETVYPPLESVPKRFAIVRRNEWMVLNSDIVVAYVLHNWGGAAQTLKYAIRNHKEIHSYKPENPLFT